MQQKDASLLAMVGIFTTGEGSIIPEQYIWVGLSLVSLKGLSFLIGKAYRLVQDEMEWNTWGEKPMELKDGALFVIFRQFTKGFNLG